LTTPLTMTGVISCYAQSEGLCGKENPALPASEALPKAKRQDHYAAILDFPGLGAVLRAAAHANLTRPVHMAHRSPLARVDAPTPAAKVVGLWPESLRA
jgi:hypothetical protein